jgi:large subunit ribosomal protein L10
LDRSNKDVIIAELTEKFARAKSIIFCDYKGMSVKDANALRRVCMKSGVDYVVAKNTLIQRSLPESVRNSAGPYLTGQTSVAVDYLEGVVAPKILFEFTKEHKTLVPKGGVMENMTLNEKQVVALSKTPSREELLSKVLGSIEAPATNTLRCISGVATKLAGLLKAYQEKLEQQQAA